MNQQGKKCDDTEQGFKLSLKADEADTWSYTTFNKDIIKFQLNKILEIELNLEKEILEVTIKTDNLIYLPLSDLSPLIFLVCYDKLCTEENNRLVNTFLAARNETNFKN